MKANPEASWILRLAAGILHAVLLKSFHLRADHRRGVMVMRQFILVGGIFLLTLCAVLAFAVPPETQGVGVYPGDPDEDFAPVAVSDTSTYRNLALHRPAYHSTSYDYNLTAQLVADGIKEIKLPRWLSTTTSLGGLANKIEREFMLDHNVTSTVDLGAENAWAQFEFAGGEAPFMIDRIEIQARIRSENLSSGFGGPGHFRIAFCVDDETIINSLPGFKKVMSKFR